MSGLRVAAVGPATSIQDAGRFGAQRFGLGTAGAMDRFAMAQANALVGQAMGAATIEVGPLPARFVAEDGPVRVAVAGAARALSAEGRPVEALTTLRLEEGEALLLKGCRAGVFTYVAVEGGIAGTPVLGSVAVHARLGLGSPYPRPLQVGDRLDVGTAGAEPERRLTPEPAADGPIRVVLGPQDDAFTPEAIVLFLQSEWSVGGASDRMAYRLVGPRLAHVSGVDIVSDGIVHGHIQVPGSGQPIVLLADRGTTGGYPKIATVITADLGRIAQVPVGGTMRFAALTVAEAQAIGAAFRARLAGLTERVERVPTLSLDQANLAGHAVHATDATSWLDLTAMGHP